MTVFRKGMPLLMAAASSLALASGAEAQSATSNQPSDTPTSGAAGMTGVSADPGMILRLRTGLAQRRFLADCWISRRLALPGMIRPPFLREA